MAIMIFDRTISFLSKALDMMSIRHQLISSNIANQDTPNYSARDIKFREELESALKVQNRAASPITGPGHIALSGSDLSSVEGEIIARSGRGGGYDGNSVNVEIEMAHMASNTILYNAAAQIISMKLRGLSNAIREGR